MDEVILLNYVLLKSIPILIYEKLPNITIFSICKHRNIFLNMVLELNFSCQLMISRKQPTPVPWCPVVGVAVSIPLVQQCQGMQGPGTANWPATPQQRPLPHAMHSLSSDSISGEDTKATNEFPNDFYFKINNISHLYFNETLLIIR